MLINHQILFIAQKNKNKYSLGAVVLLHFLAGIKILLESNSRLLLVKFVIRVNVGKMIDITL